MKSITRPTFTLLLLFLLSFFGQDIHAVSTINEHQSIHEKSSFKERIQTATSHIKKWIKATIKKAKDEFTSNKVILVLIISLLIAASILITSLLLLLGAFISIGGGGVLGGILIGAGLFLPIIILFFSFRSILKNHFKKIGKDIDRKKLNLFAILFSLAPAIIILIL